MIKVDCKAYAEEILDKVKQIPNKTRSLLILYAGDDPASAAYMKGKLKDCEKCGIPVEARQVETQLELLGEIAYANYDDSVGGIIVQLPLPEGFDEDEAVNAVRIDKDVDGFRQGSPFMPCTPEGILHVMKKEMGDDLSGLDVLLIGKGKLIGQPMIKILLDEGCTPTICHSRTKGMESKLAQWHDVVIVAAGQEGLIDLKKVNAPLTIDAGINRSRKNGKLCGDCYGFSEQEWFNQMITPVPGGIGLMTRAMLMKHMGEVQ